MNKEKFTNAILYIRGRVPEMSVEDMHKALWFVDMLQYGDTGKSITEEVYVKVIEGVHSPNLDEVLKTLEADMTAKMDCFSWEEITCLSIAAQAASDGFVNYFVNKLTESASWENTKYREPVSLDAILSKKK